MWDKILFTKTVDEFSTHHFSYTYSGDKKITKIKGSCSCFTPTFEDNTVSVKYTVKGIPYHLQAFRKYTDAKSITVFFNDGSSDVLKFEFLVTK